MHTRRDRPRANAAVGVVLACLGFAGGCTFHETTSWTDQLSPDGPCYAVNLLDGLDTASTEELHAVFACLDAGGGLAGFRPVDAAWDEPTRDGPAGIVFATWLAGAEVSGVPEALDAAAAALEDPAGLWSTLHLGLELVYGAPWSTLGALPVAEPATLDAGLLSPAQALLGEGAGLLLDVPAVRGPVVDLLRSDALRRAGWTLHGITRSSRAPAVVLATHWPDDVAAFVAAVQTPADDRAPGATGNSLHDALGWLLVRQAPDGARLWTHLAAPVAPILADAGAGAEVGAALAAADGRGELARVPNQLLWLVSVRADGGVPGAEDLTALGSLLRLLDQGNTEVTCTIDLGFTDVDIALGNLSVGLLTTLAGLDPSTAESGVDLFSDLLGVSLTGDALDLIASSGACPAIDATFVADLEAVNRLTDPESDAVLPVLIGLLGALDGHIPAVVDTASAVWELGVWPPLEDLLRDTLGTALVADLLPLVPALLDPAGWYDGTSFPEGVDPVDWGTLWGWAGTVLAPDGPLPPLQPLLDLVVEDQSTWRLVDRLALLLAAPEAESRTLLDRAADALEADPTLTVASSLADALEDEAASRPLLVLVEAEGLRAALLTTAADDPGPVPTVTGWALDGTLDRALATVRALLHLFDPEPA